MTHFLPWHVQNDKCDCGTSRFEIETDSDGITTAYMCEECGKLYADLICGAEP